MDDALLRKDAIGQFKNTEFKEDPIFTGSFESHLKYFRSKNTENAIRDFRLILSG